MSNPINIPGVGIVMLPTHQQVLDTQSVIDILLLAGTYEHTNLDSQAVGSSLDPFNADKNFNHSVIGPMGFRRAKIKGYTQPEWEAVVGSTDFKPATTAASTYHDTTASPIDPAQVNSNRIAMSWAGYSCNNQFCQNCVNASGNCGGNNADGKIGWELYNNAGNTGSNSSFDWQVTDGGGNIVTSGQKDGVAGTSIILTGSGAPPTSNSSFSLACWESHGHLPGSYTCSITNFTGGGNTYPSLNITGICLGNPPLNCIPSSPYYDVICCAGNPPVLWVGEVCVSNCPLLCKNATANCGGNNADGSIQWVVDEVVAVGGSGPNVYYEWSVTDGSGVVVNAGIYDGAAGTITVTIGQSLHTMPPFVLNAFTQTCFSSEGLLPGGYTCAILNFSDDFNTYPDMNLNGIVQGDTPLNCILGDLNYDVTCCSSVPPSTPDPTPDADCPCEGAQNCEECGGNNLI